MVVISTPSSRNKRISSKGMFIGIRLGSPYALQDACEVTADILRESREGTPYWSDAAVPVLVAAILDVCRTKAGKQRFASVLDLEELLSSRSGVSKLLQTDDLLLGMRAEDSRVVIGIVGTAGAIVQSYRQQQKRKAELARLYQIARQTWRRRS
jgi:hypothetical protein